MKLYLEINLGVSENSFCSVSDHFHDCNIIDSWIFLKYTYSTIESYKFNNKLDCSLRICNEMTNDQIQRINYFFFSTSRNTSCFSNISIFLLVCLLFFFFIRIIRIHPKMKNSRVFDNCFLPINIASRVIILKAVSNSKKKKNSEKQLSRNFILK